MKEVKELPKEVIILEEIEFPSWVGLKLYIYTDGKKYYYMQHRSYIGDGTNVRVCDAYYRTTSLKKIIKYIKEVAHGYGFKFILDKINNVCYNIAVVW